MIESNIIILDTDRKKRMVCQFVIDISTKEEASNPVLGYNGKINNFLVYNGINQYINDNSRNVAAPEKRAEVDSKVFEFMLETV